MGEDLALDLALDFVGNFLHGLVDDVELASFASLSLGLKKVSALYLAFTLAWSLANIFADNLEYGLSKELSLGLAGIWHLV